jgi:hypothetical protein
MTNRPDFLQQNPLIRLARPVVTDHRLPWERPCQEGKLTTLSGSSRPFAVSATFAAHRQPAETVWEIARSAQTCQIGAGSSLSRHQKAGVTLKILSNPRVFGLRTDGRPLAHG